MPLLAMMCSFSARSGLPEIIVHALRREQAPERHLEMVADRDLTRLDVRQLAREPSAALVVHDRRHDGRLERVCQMIERVGGDPARGIGETLGAHLVEGAALDAHALRREMPRLALLATRADEGELPALVPAHGRGGRALRVGAARRLEGQNAAPFEIAVVGEVVPLGRDPAVDLAHGWRRLDGVGRLEHERLDAVGDTDDEDPVARLRLIERTREEEPRVCDAGPADARGQRVRELLGRRPRVFGRPATLRGFVPSRTTVASVDGSTFAAVSARATVSVMTGAMVSAVKRSSHWRGKRSSGRRQTSRISIVADARPRTRAMASRSRPVTNATAPSPPWLSRAPPGRPATRSLAQTRADRPASARSSPRSSAAMPIRVEPPRPTEAMLSGRSSAA
jgi:hypothetical protein